MAAILNTLELFYGVCLTTMGFWAPVIDPFLPFVKIIADYVDLFKRDVLDDCTFFVSLVLSDMMQIVFIGFIAYLTVGVILVRHWLRNDNFDISKHIGIFLMLSDLVLDILKLSTLFNSLKIVHDELFLSTRHCRTESLWSVHV